MFVHSSETRAESVDQCLNPSSVFLGHAPFPHHRNAVPRLPGILHCASWAVCVTVNIQTRYCVTEIRPPSVCLFLPSLSLSFLFSIRRYLTCSLPPLFPDLSAGPRPSHLPGPPGCRQSHCCYGYVYGVGGGLGIVAFELMTELHLALLLTRCTCH